MNHDHDHNDLRPYVWALIVTAIITMAGLYVLSRHQLHQPTPAQEEKLFQAARLSFNDKAHRQAERRPCAATG